MIQNGLSFDIPMPEANGYRTDVISMGNDRAREKFKRNQQKNVKLVKEECIVGKSSTVDVMERSVRNWKII